jgi:hypothetical protein
VFHLDYLSCGLTVLSTILVGRKHWSGLLIGSVNCIIVCLIGMKTAQFGFIPANVFCIGIYAFNMRSWMRTPETVKDSAPELVESSAPRKAPIPIRPEKPIEAEMPQIRKTYAAMGRVQPIR